MASPTPDSSAVSPPCILDLQDVQFSQEELMTYIQHRFGGKDDAAPCSPGLLNPPLLLRLWLGVYHNRLPDIEFPMVGSILFPLFPIL